MAYTVHQLRAERKTSIYGRRLGLDRRDFLVGPLGLRFAIEDIQSTVPTTLALGGLTRILTSGSSQGPTQHILPAPIPGVEKIVMLHSTSTGSQQLLSTPNGASIFLATAGTTVGVVNLVGPGGGITLVGISTAIWGIRGVSGSTAGGAPTFSTST